MLQFCRDQAPDHIKTILWEIERSKISNPGLDQACLVIPPIGGDLATGDAFLLWDALGRESNCPTLVRLLGGSGLMLDEKKTRLSMSKKMKALNVMSKNFTRDMSNANKKHSITARLCALLSGGSSMSSRSTVDQTVYNEEETSVHDDDVSPSFSFSSSRHPMEQVVDAVVDVDVDVVIPQLSQPSQLSLVYLEVNEVSPRPPLVSDVTFHSIELARENSKLRGQLLVAQVLQEDTVAKQKSAEITVTSMKNSQKRVASRARTRNKHKRVLEEQALTDKKKIVKLERAIEKFQAVRLHESEFQMLEEDHQLEAEAAKGPWNKQLDGSFAPSYWRHIASLYSEGMSTAAVRNCLNSHFSTLLESDAYDVPSATYCDKVRAAMAHVEHLNVALRIGRCKQILQIFHDGSSLNGTDNFCLSVHIEYVDGTREKLVCGVVVPAGKSSQEEYESILLWFERSVDMISRLRSYLIKLNYDPDLFNVCAAMECTLAKSRSTMNDNAATAKATAQLLKRHVIDAKKSCAVALVATPEPQRRDDQIVSDYVEHILTNSDTNHIGDGNGDGEYTFFSLTCWAHLRVLVLGEGTKKATELLCKLLQAKKEYSVSFTEDKKVHANARGKSEFVTQDSITNSIQKFFNAGEDPYAFGKGKEFFKWVQIKCAKYYNMGRAGLGSRHDVKHENAVAIYMMLPLIMEFVQSCVDSSTANQLCQMIRDCYSTRPYVADLRTRAILWRRFGMDMRYLCQAIIRHWELWDMARVANHLHAEFGYMITNPTVVLERSWYLFKIEEWPMLTDFRTSTADEVVDNRLYDDFSTDDMITLIPQFVSAYAEGGYASIERNMKDYLTKFNGELSPATWTEERKEKATGFNRTNMQMAEAPFAFVDHLKHTFGSKSSMIVLSGIASAKANGSYLEPGLSPKKKKHKDAPSKPLATVKMFDTIVVDAMSNCMMVSKTFDHFQNLAKFDLETQQVRMVDRKALEREEKWGMLVRKQQDITAYHGLQRVVCEEDLRQILSLDHFLKSEPRALEFVKSQIRIYTIGHCLSQFKCPFSSNTDKTVGTFANLRLKLFHIIRDVQASPSLLLKEVPNLYSSHNPDYDAATTEQDRNWKLQKAMQLASTCSLEFEKFSIRMQKPWRLVGIEKKPHPIAEPLRHHVTGSSFVATRLVFKNVACVDPIQSTYIIVGWMWDGGSKKDYRIYYYLCSELDESKPTNLDDSRIGYVYSKHMNTEFKFP